MGASRSLLFAETDQFGNVVDPSTKQIITVAGGKSPYPLPPWLSQPPAILRWMNRTTVSVTAEEGKDQRNLQDAATQTKRYRDESTL